MYEYKIIQAVVLSYLTFPRVYGRASVNSINKLCKRMFLNLVYGRASVNFVHVFCKRIIYPRFNIFLVYDHASVNSAYISHKRLVSLPKLNDC